MPPQQPPRWLPLPQPRSQWPRAAGSEPRAHWRAAVASQLDGYPDRTHFPIGRWGLWDSPRGSPGEAEDSAPGPGIAPSAPGHPLSTTPGLDHSRRVGLSSGRAWRREAGGRAAGCDQGCRQRLLRRDLLGPRLCGRGSKRGAGVSESWPAKSFPSECQYGWGAVRRTGASRGRPPRMPLFYPERVLGALRLSTRAHARAQPGPRPAPAPRVPGLSQLQPPLAAAAAPQGCRCPEQSAAGELGAGVRSGGEGIEHQTSGKRFPPLGSRGRERGHRAEGRLARGVGDTKCIPFHSRASTSWGKRKAQ
ncbi:unnamed protein product [Nyctereutes procyonoides]|uniref:(raccoon dog) hypothetical protein n=1 Tax=Nyctereutes procyonoides TaxID=34880 RepID=A0A811XT10_NYCPR|nr:unnamed protein product [Nyctereutes procyonoides]